MIKRTLLILALGFTLNAAETSTTTTFQFMGKGEDKHGNAYQEKKVTISTQNYKVENFWNKFSFSGSGQDRMEFNTVSTAGVVRMTTEATSICTLYPELDSDGCSGQKPFLINNTGAIKNLALGNTITLRFQKDFNNTLLQYNAGNDTVFYPLDIERSDKYYKPQLDNHKSFFGLFGQLFSSFFSNSFFGSFFNYNVVDESNSDANATDYRQRYIANIMAGVDQDHLMTTAQTELSFTPNSATNADRVSMIDYSETTANPGNCRLFLFKFDSGNGFCNFMGGLPFLSIFSSSRPDAIYTTDTIQEDTQNSLVSLAGKTAKITMTSYQNDVLYQQSATSPIASLFTAIKCLFFGCSSSIVEPATDVVYNFTDANAMTLTMALAESNNTGIIAGFKTFKLMAIHNVASRERQCKVKYSGGFIGGSSWEYVFTPSDGANVSATKTSGWGGGTVSVDNSNITVEGNNYINFLEWCDAVASNSVIDAASFPFLSIFFGGGYTVVESAYINSSKKALLLDLKLIDLKPTDQAVKVRYKLMRVEQ